MNFLDVVKYTLIDNLYVELIFYVYLIVYHRLLWIMGTVTFVFCNIPVTLVENWCPHGPPHPNFLSRVFSCPQCLYIFPRPHSLHGRPQLIHCWIRNIRPHMCRVSHKWELPVLCYHRIRVNYPYSFLGVIFWVVLRDFIRKKLPLKPVKLLPFFPHYGKLIHD